MEFTLCFKIMYLIFLSMVTYSYNRSTKRQKQEEHEFEDSLSFIVSSGTAWSTVGLVSQGNHGL